MNDLPEDAMADMQRVSRLIGSQDNRATADPMFIVQEKVRIHGVNSDHTDTFQWNDSKNDFVEADANRAALLDAFDCYSDDEVDGWIRTGYVDRWEFVTACFTEEGCKDYIAVNGHNLNQPRIYVASAYRNKEFNTVREVLKLLGESSPTSRTDQ